MDSLSAPREFRMDARTRRRTRLRTAAARIRPHRHAPLFGAERLEPRQMLATWSGDIPDGTVWTSAQVQQIAGNVHIPAGATLTIQPGTVVKFNAFQNLNLKVDGTLLAPGTSA